MKTSILSLIISFAIGIGLTSCSDDTWNPGSTTLNGEGVVSLSSIKVSVDADEAVVSRAGVSTDAFLIDILDKKSGIVKRSYTYSSMPEVISLAEGDYTVNVRSHNVKDAEWEAPYYVGQADFSIEVGKITEIGTILCKFSNIKVTVNYTKELASYMGDDAKVRVIANDRGELDYSATETRPGYFAAIEGSTTLVAEFSATIKGNYVNALKTFTDVKAGQHYIITFSVKNGSATLPEEFGSLEVSGIRIDADMKHETLGGNAPAGDENQQGTTVRPGNEEWPDEPTPGPGPDDPNIPDDPTPPSTQQISIEPDETCSYLNLDGIANQVLETNIYKINIHADNKIQNLIIDIASNNESFIESAGDMLPLNFDLAHLDPELYEKLYSLGLKGNEAVLDQYDVPFDVTNLVTTMLIYFEGIHTFTITVSDTDGNTLSKSLILEVKES